MVEANMTQCKISHFFKTILPCVFFSQSYTMYFTDICYNVSYMYMKITRDLSTQQMIGHVGMHDGALPSNRGSEQQYL